jgi:hypothetical protein
MRTNDKLLRKPSSSKRRRLFVRLLVKRNETHMLTDLQKTKKYYMLAACAVDIFWQGPGSVCFLMKEIFDEDGIYSSKNDRVCRGV